MTRNELAERIHVRSLITGEFLLRSGATATEYFDKYLFESDPALLKAIAEAMSANVPPAIDALAGLEMGGIPLVTMISQITGIPALFVRKKAKEYGTCRLAEGGEVDGKRLLVIEDVVTSGGQIILSTKDLRDLGGTVEQAICVIDREAGGTEKLLEAGIRLESLFKMSELKATAAS